MKPEYVPPTLRASAFNCVHCSVYTHQEWYYLNAAETSDGYGTQYSDKNFEVSHCKKCGATTIWFEGKIIHPIGASVAPPNADLPDQIKDDYNEAALIAQLSPRGAAALLRLSLQKLCKTLGQPGKNLNTEIKALVASGLPPKVQEALDSVRVIGNDAVHPGVLDLRDDYDTVVRLFKLINFIAQKMITDPREIDEMYANLPHAKIDAIETRDQER